MLLLHCFTYSYSDGIDNLAYQMDLLKKHPLIWREWFGLLFPFIQCDVFVHICIVQSRRTNKYHRLLLCPQIYSCICVSLSIVPALWLAPGTWVNIKLSSYQCRKSHCGYKTTERSSYLHNGISYTARTTSLYWIDPLEAWFKCQQDCTEHITDQCYFLWFELFVSHAKLHIDATDVGKMVLLWICGGPGHD